MLPLVKLSVPTTQIAFTKAVEKFESGLAFYAPELLVEGQALNDLLYAIRMHFDVLDEKSINDLKEALARDEYPSKK